MPRAWRRSLSSLQRNAMSLSCECDPYDGEWWYLKPKDYVTAPVLGRRHRCCSCKAFIKPLSLCGRFERERTATEFEEFRLGVTEIGLAPYWMCESCFDLYLSLEELGFCIELPDNMRELVREYAEVYA